ncbi:hypothetical protein CEXT_9001 [Caerostris extrusa]|uniref:Uncharacterized protein n=1 Tax=Caerostris extrusa TaxID=172846 RepID=A0AAV4PGN7_CAEEX|nr:hypothetical protein CEXT_9001 [Caerostris extrusa]
MQSHRSSLYLESTAKRSESLTSSKLGFIPVRLNYSVETWKTLKITENKIKRSPEAPDSNCPPKMTLVLKGSSTHCDRSPYLESTTKLSKSLTSSKLGFIPVRLNYSVGILSSLRTKNPSDAINTVPLSALFPFIEEWSLDKWVNWFSAGLRRKGP